MKDGKDGKYMGENILSDDMHMYGTVFSVLGKCTDDYLFVLDIKNDKYVISDSAAATWTDLSWFLPAQTIHRLPR